MMSDLGMKMEEIMGKDLNFMATELRLGLPGTNEVEDISSSTKNNKRASPESAVDGRSHGASSAEQGTAPAMKAHMVGWPPVRSYRKNSFQVNKMNPEPGIYVKVSMDGAPYLRKIDLKVYSYYAELIEALENMFKLSIGEYSEREGYKGSEYAPAYEDKDGDLMLVGDVPWDMFVSSCKRLRIMRRSEAGSLGSSP